MSVIDNLYLDDVSVKTLIAKARAQANQAQQQRTQTITVKEDYAANIPEYIREKMGDASLQTHEKFEQERQKQQMHYANKHSLTGTPITDEEPNILEPSNVFVTQTDLMTGTKLNPDVKLPEKTHDSFETASGAIIKALHLENKPYTGDGKEEPVELEWITPTGEHVKRTIDENKLDKEAWWVKERAKDVAQGAIATVIFPSDVMMLAINRDKLKGLSLDKVKTTLLESAKTGELEAELLGGLLVGGAVNAIVKKGVVEGTTEAVTNSVDDVVKAGAGTTDDIMKNLDDLMKSSAKSNTDDMLKFTVKGPQEQTVPIGAKTSKYINLDLGDIKIQGDKNYLRIEAGGKRGEIFNKGGILDIRGELWKDKDLLKTIDQKLALHAPDERHVIKPILDEFSNIKWVPENSKSQITKSFLEEWSGWFNAKETALYNPEAWREISWLSRPGATAKQKLLLRNTEKKIIYIDAPPEWKAMKRLAKNAGVETSDVLLTGAGGFGPISLEMANIFGNKESPFVPTPQIPESMQRALKKNRSGVFEVHKNQREDQLTQILTITQKKIKPSQTQTPNTATTPIMTYAPRLIEQIKQELEFSTDNKQEQIHFPSQKNVPKELTKIREKPAQIEIPKEKTSVGVSTILSSIAVAKLKNTRVTSKRRFKPPGRGGIALSGGGGALWKKSGRKNKNKIFSLKLPKPKNPFVFPKKRGGRKNGIF